MLNMCVPVGRQRSKGDPYSSRPGEGQSVQATQNTGQMAWIELTVNGNAEEGGHGDPADKVATDDQDGNLEHTGELFRAGIRRAAVDAQP